MKDIMREEIGVPKIVNRSTFQRRHDCFRDASPMNRNEDRQLHPARGAADWISLAAAPTFAIMALLTSILGGEAPDMLCSAAHASPLAGMIPMYLLMSAFHSAPWLKLTFRQESGARGSLHTGLHRLR